jgi:2-polyprenyl-3-methyl-5-hydroxy-6-metoxy-1,4-benzoquinol methylase
VPTQSSPIRRETVDARAAELRLSRFHRGNRELLAERVRSIKGGKARVLEIGCGHLDFTFEYLVGACGELVATDLERLFPEDTKLPEGVTFQTEDALDLSFDDGVFDCVIALEVIEHIDDDDKFVSESLRVLRPGGKLIFTTPNRLRLTSLARYVIGKPIRFPHTYAIDPVLGPIHHFREYSYGDMKELLRRHESEIGAANVEGIGLGVPAWQLVVTRSGPLHRLGFDWHVTLQKREAGRA